MAGARYGSGTNHLSLTAAAGAWTEIMAMIYPPTSPADAGHALAAVRQRDRAAVSSKKEKNNNENAGQH